MTHRNASLVDSLNTSTADTLVPPSYDALTAEAYHLLPDVCDRDTELPPPSVQLTLELECAGLEAW
jgi:hypothetical protein